MFHTACIDLGGPYIIVRGAAVHRGPFADDRSYEPVSPVESRAILESALRRDPALLARLWADLRGERAAGQPTTRIPSGIDACLARVLEAFGPRSAGAPARSGIVRFQLLRRRASPHGQTRSAIEEERREQQRIDAALVKLGRAPLLQGGRRYRLLRVGSEGARVERHGYEVQSEATLFQVLRELTKRPALPHHKEALAELLSVADAQHSQTGRTDLLLLQEIRTFTAPVEHKGPALTPSRLRKEAHWIEVVTRDENGAVVAGVQVELELSDGSRNVLKTNEEGFARLERVPAGDVTLGVAKRRAAR